MEELQAKERAIELQRKAKERVIELKRKYGNAIGIRISNGEMWIGMSEAMLYDSWGRPQRVNQTVFSNMVKKQLVYRNHYVYVENGEVVSYQSSY